MLLRESHQVSDEIKLITKKNQEGIYDNGLLSTQLLVQNTLRTTRYNPYHPQPHLITYSIFHSNLNYSYCRRIRQRSEEGGELALLRFGTLFLVLSAEPTLILSPIRVIEIHTGVNDSTNEWIIISSGISHREKVRQAITRRLSYPSLWILYNFLKYRLKSIRLLWLCKSIDT